MFNLRENHILQAAIIIALVALAIILKTVLVVFFIAFLITTFLHPTVGWLHKRHVPIGFAVLIPIIGLFVLVGLLVYFVAPQVVEQSKQFANHFPKYIAEIQNNGLNLHLSVDSIKDAVQSQFGTISGVVFSASKAVVEILVGVVSIFVVSLYWLGSYDRVQQTALSFVPAKSRARAGDIWARIEKKLFSWVMAQVLLGVVVGILVWIGALIIGLPFAGVLGLIAGILEIIPTLGPIAAAVPGVLLGLTLSWQTALAALILYVIVQQLENHLLAPWLLGRTVKLSPIIVIFSLLVGAVLYGIIGALLAVPIALVISAVVDSYRDGKPKLKPSSNGVTIKS